MKRHVIVLGIAFFGQFLIANGQVRLVQQPKKSFSHKVGTLWNAVTNNGYWGNAYSEPNFEWPGGSGNVYGWRTSLWIGAVFDTVGYTSYGEGNHFVPLDTIQVKRRAQGSLSAEDTYTRYTDVNPPAPSGVHKNLGVEITERTYAWDQSYNDYLIISDYWIKNIGDDVNKDGLIDATRTLTGVYVGFRMDCDVSGFNGTSTDTNYWDQDDLAGYDAANKIVYLWDGDSPKTPENDTGNPDPVTGVLRSPGYVGIRLLYADRSHFVGSYTGQPTMGTPSYQYFEPTTSQAMYEYMKNNGIAPNTTEPKDYRVIMGIGPFTLPAGDSIHVVVAWLIGNGFSGMIENSRTAQSLFEKNYISAVGAYETRELPNKHFLSQNYPNPFNSTTTIRYELPKPTNVSLRIFNTLGQTAATLVDEHEEQGYYQVHWNANVPSGIYFYRLQAGEYVETKRMILLR